LVVRRPSSTLFPYTTLFRSQHQADDGGKDHPEAQRGGHGNEQLRLGAGFTQQRQHPSKGGERGQHNWPEAAAARLQQRIVQRYLDRKSTRLNSSHVKISYAV